MFMKDIVEKANPNVDNLKFDKRIADHSTLASLDPNSPSANFACPPMLYDISE